LKYLACIIRSIQQRLNKKGGEKVLKNKSIIFLVIAVLLLTLFVGCSPARKPANDMTNRSRNQTTEQNKNNRNNSMTTDDEMDARESSRIADQLADEATKVKGVKSASVVFTNKTAIVGLNLEANIEGDQTEDIKQEVTNRLKRANKKVETVSISTDADTVTRIRKIAKGIAEGRPVSEFAKELSEITRRITPSVK